MDELGPAALLQAGLSPSALKRKCQAGSQTAARLAYDHGRLEIQGSSLFSWQCHVRKLVGFKLRHTQLYAMRSFLAPFLRWLLQVRWNIKKKNLPALQAMLGDSTGTGLLLFGLGTKLIANSFYGYSALRTDLFSESTVLTSKTLNKKKFFEAALCGHAARPVPPPNCYYFNCTGEGFCPKCEVSSSWSSSEEERWNISVPVHVLDSLRDTGCPSCGVVPNSICGVPLGEAPDKLLANPLSLTMLGQLVSRRSKRAPTIDTVYLLTKKSDTPVLKNVASVAATILSSSKVLFFDKIFSLLWCLSSSHCGLLYTDTGKSFNLFSKATKTCCATRNNFDKNRCQAFGFSE